jgi:hypothetical protein
MNLQNSISTCLIQPYFEIGATPIWEKNPVRHSVFVDRTSPSIDPKWLKNICGTAQFCANCSLW